MCHLQTVGIKGLFTLLPYLPYFFLLLKEKKKNI
nr:MAG TPA: hypothetical protein [Caudoviricetes sp.]